MCLYLKQKEPLIQELVRALGKSFPYVSILGQDSLGMRLSVSKSGVNVSEDSLFTNRGFVARIHNGSGFCEYSFNEISEEKLEGILNAIQNLAAEVLGVDALPEDEACAQEYCSPYRIDPEALGSEAIIDRLSVLRSNCLKAHPEILDLSMSLSWQKGRKLFVSKNRRLYQDILWTNASVVAISTDGTDLKDYYRPFSGLCGAELLDEITPETLNDACHICSELLTSKSIEPGEYDCICDPDVTGMIVHEAFGHGVEMDMFVKDRALAQAYIGSQVASPLITMHDSACAVEQCASYLFDDEGTLSRDNIIIQNGILKTGYADSVSAARLGACASGNGRRESYKRKAYTRMTNTYFESGSCTPEEMISSVKHGYLLENPSSGMEDPKNWGIQCMVNIAREIKDGRLTGRVFSPIVLTGYVPDLLKSISMVSNKVVLSGSGYCGKGYKEWVKVSDGGPYIRAQIRLG